MGQRKTGTWQYRLATYLVRVRVLVGTVMSPLFGLMATTVANACIILTFDEPNPENEVPRTVISASFVKRVLADYPEQRLSYWFDYTAERC